MVSWFTSKVISIHALRVEGDRPKPAHGDRVLGISIHALRVEGDGLVKSPVDVFPRFLSTPSGWRATEDVVFNRDIFNPISIHALRVEGDASAYSIVTASSISIHALRVEGDRKVFHP